MGRTSMTDANRSGDPGVEPALRALALALKSTPELQTYLEVAHAVDADTVVQGLLERIRTHQFALQWDGGDQAGNSSALAELQGDLARQPVVQSYYQAEHVLRELFRAVDAAVSAAAGVDFAANARCSCCGGRNEPRPGRAEGGDITLPGELDQLARQLGRSLHANSAVRAYLEATARVEADPEAGALDRQVEELYRRLLGRQQAGEQLSRAEVSEFRALQSRVRNLPPIAERDLALDQLKSYMVGVGLDLSSLLGLDYTALAGPD